MTSSKGSLNKGQGDGSDDSTFEKAGGFEQSVELKPADEVKKETSTNQKALIIAFLLMVAIGLGNKIFQKLMTIPMQNYAVFQSLYVTFVYIPISFAYIWPMILWGSQITPDQRAIPQYKWLIMGSLDATAGVMQTFAVNKLTGSLVILLVQSAIPISMLISKLMLKAKYKPNNYIGSAIVVAGLVIVLVPKLLGGSTGGLTWPQLLAWSLVLIFSCVPMTLSSVYKEKALGDQEIDVVYLNGYVALYQFLASLPLMLPGAYAMGVTPAEIPQNIWWGLKCYVGINSIFADSPGPLVPCNDGVPTIANPPSNYMCPDVCGESPLFVNIYIGFNVLYNILIILILKYGSSNLLWLAMTIMVPLGNVAFSLKFVPGHSPLEGTDIAGLVVIMIGLIIYRFWAKIYELISPYIKKKDVEADPLLAK
eukprot:TRINITY_DN2465_c0_g2_i1.p1 TRINITY_DN2465_c0_g2~~TRINITY_DN2465_c0_g2_i1.p1  ORF type:complete len:442 (-),score=142.55 TRINITY_DN2465_c0_g2_i1:1420-2688(-)